METLVHKLQAIVEQKAHIYRLDPKWLFALIDQESGWNPYAVRYEPNYKYLYTPERFTDGGIVIYNPERFAAGGRASLETEIMLQKTSFGLGQLMGGLLREQGFKAPFLTEALAPELNIEHMCIRITALRAKSSDFGLIAAGYNGGIGAMRKPNKQVQRYVASVLSHLSKL